MNENLQQLKHCLQMLALPVTAQIRLLAGQASGITTLSHAFHIYHRAARAGVYGPMTPEQAAALTRLSAALGRLHQSGTATPWSDAGLRSSAGWRHVRRFSRRALVAFGWSLDLPPADFMTSKQNSGDQHHAQWQTIRYTNGLSHHCSGTTRPEVVRLV
jgi:hypothetical protein